MGNKYESDKRERRRVKRSDRQDWKSEAGRPAQGDSPQDDPELNRPAHQDYAP